MLPLTTLRQSKVLATAIVASCYHQTARLNNISFTFNWKPSVSSPSLCTMRATLPLFRQCLRLTMFTRPHCSLCDDAKGVLARVWERRPFEYDEVDVMKAKHKKWKPLYEFETPVVLTLNRFSCVCSKLTLIADPHRCYGGEQPRFRNHR